MSLLHLQRAPGIKRWLGVVAVLAFGFRALIPTGYMLAEVGGHSRLVICPAGIHYAATEHSMAGMAHAGGMNPGAHASLGAEQCPFALAGGAAIRTAVGEAAKPNFVILQPSRPFAATSVPITPPSRYHAPRGPPSLA